jgi:porphobilinogen synthase
VKSLVRAPRRAARDLPVTAHLAKRARRLRRTAAIRSLVRETRLAPASLVAPLFVISGKGRQEPIASLPGHSRLSVDLAVAHARELATLGVGGLLLFGIPDSKDAGATGAADPEGPVPDAVRRIRDAGIELVLAADVCLCQYASHGHCGVLAGGEVDNDGTLLLLGEAAIAYAEAGADVVAPSAMMDGQVAALRRALDMAGYQQTAILAYASKAASALYGPFRDAAGSSPLFGDRKSYQVDYANGRAAIREMELDAAEGADLLMVKPAITSLDLLSRARDLFNVPLAAYQVSGEAAMIEAAAERGWIDRKLAVLETSTAIARAGADVIISYFAADLARWLATDTQSRSRSNGQHEPLL